MPRVPCLLKFRKERNWVKEILVLKRRPRHGMLPGGVRCYSGVKLGHIFIAGEDVGQSQGAVS